MNTNIQSLYYQTNIILAAALSYWEYFSFGARCERIEKKKR